MAPGAIVQAPPPRRSGDETKLDQIGLDHFLDRVARLGEAGGQRLHADRATLVDVGDHVEVAPVHRVEAELIDLHPVERAVGGPGVDLGHAGGMREIADPAEQPAGDARRAARAAGDLVGAVLGDRGIEQARGAAHDLLELGEDGAHEVARRSRGTPRIAGRLLRRVRDFAHAVGAEAIDAAVADRALDRLEIDALGLDAMDRRYLTMIADLYNGGPVGVETLDRKSVV